MRFLGVLACFALSSALLMACQRTELAPTASHQEVVTYVQEGQESYAPTRPGVKGSVTVGDIDISYKLLDGFYIVGGDMLFGSELEIIQSFSQDHTGELSPLASMGGAIWPGDIIPWQINVAPSDPTHGEILSAISHWERHTPLRFARFDAGRGTGRLRFNGAPAGGGCSAELGYRSDYNDVWLAPECLTGNIIHEIGHALGLIHEHQRPGRDSYVDINEPNIKRGDQYSQQSGFNLGGYDYRSIMHYALDPVDPDEIFTNDDSRPAMFLAPGKSAPTGSNCYDRIGQRCALVQADVNGMVNRYSRYSNLCDASVNEFCTFNSGTLGSSNTSDEFTFTNNTAGRRHRTMARSDDYSTQLSHALFLDQKNISGDWTTIRTAGPLGGNVTEIDVALGAGTFRWRISRTGTTTGAYDLYRVYYP